MKWILNRLGRRRTDDADDDYSCTGLVTRHMNVRWGAYKDSASRYHSLWKNVVSKSVQSPTKTQRKKKEEEGVPLIVTNLGVLRLEERIARFTHQTVLSSSSLTTGPELRNRFWVMWNSPSKEHNELRIVEKNSFLRNIKQWRRRRNRVRLQFTPFVPSWTETTGYPTACVHLSMISITETALASESARHRSYTQSFKRKDIWNIVQKLISTWRNEGAYNSCCITILVTIQINVESSLENGLCEIICNHSNHGSSFVVGNCIKNLINFTRVFDFDFDWMWTF